MRSFIGKAFFICGFLGLFVALLFIKNYDQWVTSLGFVATMSFFLLGWVAVTGQFAHTSFRRKFSATLLCFSILFFTSAGVCQFYRNIGSEVHVISAGMTSQLISAEKEIWGKPTHLERYSPDTKMLVTSVLVHPYSEFSVPLVFFVVLLLSVSLVLRVGRLHRSGKESYRLARPKLVAFGVTIFLVGTGLFLLSSLSLGYCQTYEDLMSGSLTVPSAYGNATEADQEVHSFELLPQYIDFLFRPWFDCVCESQISVPSSNDVTFTVFLGNESLVNSTSNDIQRTLNLQANVLYTFRIRSTVNQKTTIVMSTKIDGPTSSEVTLVGATLAFAGALVTIILAREERRHLENKL